MAGVWWAMGGAGVGAGLMYLADPRSGRLRRVRGVRALDDGLEVHKRADNHPALQGGRVRRGKVPGPLQLNWSPTMRLFASLGGVGLAAWGFSRRGVVGTATRFVGLTLGLRGLTNLPLKRLIGVGAGRLAISLHKDIEEVAPTSGPPTY